MANGEGRRSLRAQITGGAGAAAAPQRGAGVADDRPVLERALSMRFPRLAPGEPHLEPGGGGETFVTELQRQLLSNILNVPAATLELARAGAVQGRSPLGGLPLPPEDVDLRIDPDRVTAGVRAAGRLATEGMGEGGLGGLFSSELEAVQQERAARREQSPGAAVAGEVGGDVASLLIGRAPVDRLRRALPALRAAETAAPGARRAAARLLNRPATQRVLRGLGRASESGLEGATLAVLNRGDPLETAALSGGMQIGGSLSLEALRHARQHPGLAGAVFGGAAVLQVLREATPGGRDFITHAIEDSAEKTAALLGLGVLAGLAGGGRIRGTQFADDFPRLAEAITSLPRGSMHSLAVDLLGEDEAGRDETQVAIDALSRDPEFFGEGPSNRIARAIRDPRKKVSAEVNRLMRSRAFRERLDQARQELAAAETQAAEAAEGARAAAGGALERARGAPGQASPERAATPSSGPQRTSLRDRILGRAEAR